MEIGQKVTYHSCGKVECGVVKSISDAEHVFVVYHCDDNWDRYREYTSARTRITDLSSGWPEERAAENSGAVDEQLTTGKVQNRYDCECDGCRGF